MRGTECPAARPCRRADRTGSPVRLSPCRRVSSAKSGYYLVFAGSSPITSPRSLQNIPEVRVLPSAGVTRLQRYHDPVRRPPGPVLLRTVEAATLIPRTGLPRLRNPCLDVLYPLPRWTGPGAFVGCFPSPCCL